MPVRSRLRSIRTYLDPVSRRVDLIASIDLSTTPSLRPTLRGSRALARYCVSWMRSSSSAESQSAKLSDMRSTS